MRHSQRNQTAMSMHSATARSTIASKRVNSTRNGVLSPLGDSKDTAAVKGHPCVSSVTSPDLPSNALQYVNSVLEPFTFAQINPPSARWPWRDEAEGVCGAEG